MKTMPRFSASSLDGKDLLPTVFQHLETIPVLNDFAMLDIVESHLPMLSMASHAIPLGGMLRTGINIYNFQRIRTRLDQQQIHIKDGFNVLSRQNQQIHAAIVSGVKHLALQSAQNHEEVIQRLADQDQMLEQIAQLVQHSTRLLAQDLNAISHQLITLQDSSLSGASRHIEEATGHLKNYLQSPTPELKALSKSLFHQALGHALHKLADGIDSYSTPEKRVQAMLYYGICCAYQGLPDQAVRYIDKALSSKLKREITPEVYRQLAQRQIQSDQWQPSALIFSELAMYKSEQLTCESKPKEVFESRLMLADILGKLEFSDEAEKEYLELIQSHHTGIFAKAIASNNLGTLYLSLNAPKKALFHYKKALGYVRRQPSIDQELVQLIHINIAKCKS